MHTSEWVLAETQLHCTYASISRPDELGPRASGARGAPVSDS